MKTKDLNNKDTNELLQILSDLRFKLAKFSFEIEANTLKNTGQIKTTKKDIARILTVLKQLKSPIFKS